LNRYVTDIFFYLPSFLPILVELCDLQATSHLPESSFLKAVVQPMHAKRFLYFDWGRFHRRNRFGFLRHYDPALIKDCVELANLPKFLERSRAVSLLPKRKRKVE
jgi:hypothetical protein